VLRASCPNMSLFSVFISFPRFRARHPGNV
jgi:hypothetical protein